MFEAVIIYPHQLFERHPALKKGRIVFLVEDPLFFTQYAFHKQKLVLHRASMKSYAEKLEKKGHAVHYFESSKLRQTEDVGVLLKRKKIQHVWAADLVDDWLEKRLRKGLKEVGAELHVEPSPGFLTPSAWSRDFFAEKKSYFFTSFYVEQRKRLGVLLKNGKPVGGKWTFDSENRASLSAGLSIPAIPVIRETRFVKEAKDYVRRHFPNQPGSIDDFSYPTTTNSALRVLDSFLNNRLELFGTYQDAIAEGEPFLFHSLLTPALNIGLITPEQVLHRTLAFADNNKVPLNSLEGFLRQLIGWREYMRIVYELEGKRQRTINFFKYSRPIPQSFWEGATGIAPVDDVIGRVNRHAYAHHIERLMVLGNFMLLCEFDPDEVYRWFMELFIDAYDWVMVPNVYGMSQYADGGLITTKPYVSSSNYILKMSNFKKGSWCEIWDGLYWRFIYKHRKKFEKNVRMKMMLVQLGRMDADKLKGHQSVAKRFLKELDGK